ncbi:MAG: diacylglycerol kinase family protein [Acidobacteriota bacterium]
MAAPGGISVIINERSGTAARVDAGHQIQALFAEAGAQARIERVHNPGDIAARARQAAARGDTLVAAGGDGTLNAVAGVAIATNSTFAVLPMGTLNHFAKDVRIPLDLAAAVAVVVAGHHHDLDVGEVNGHLFLNNSSVGLYPRMVWERHAEQRKGHSKWVAFLIASVRTWRQYSTTSAHVSIDGKPLAVRTPFIFVGNNTYTLEGLEIGARAALDRGNISVFIAPECGRFEILALPFRALARRLAMDPTLVHYDARDVRVDLRRRRVGVSLDGEIVVMQPPLQYRVRAGVLRTLVPAPVETDAAPAGLVRQDAANRGLGTEAAPGSSPLERTP